MLATKSLLKLDGTGYIAGLQDGIVTKGGVKAAAKISVLDADSLKLVMVTCSTPQGNYMLSGLDVSKKYLLMARDNMSSGGEMYAPVCWDSVKPADDLSVEQQQSFWQSCLT